MPATEQQREDRRIVERYLLMIDTAGDRRHSTLDAADTALAKMPERIREAKSRVKRLFLTQEAMNLQRTRDALAKEPEMVAAFLNVAVRFSEDHGISQGAWREYGVPPVVLKALGFVEAAPTPTVRANGSSSGRPDVQNAVLDYLQEHGPVEDENGHATGKLAKALNMGTISLSSALRRLDAAEKIERDTKDKRTFRIALRD